MNVSLTRRAKFSAGHSYFLPALTQSENAEVFGAHSSLEGHGHNYIVAVTVAGEVDKRTGIVVNIVEIDRVIKENVVAHVDGKFLNREVQYFKSNAPTTEKLVIYAREQLEDHLPRSVFLTGIVVFESDTLWSSWENRSEQKSDSLTKMDTLVQITRKYDFSAAHRLNSVELSEKENIELFGKCNHPNFHGHNYEIEVSLSGTPNERSGMLYDLDKLDLIVNDEILKPMDHRNLNLDIPEFESMNPTSEMLAVVIWNRLAKLIPTVGNPKLAKVLVRETARNEFEYCGS